jgi:predicted polyphosphate/ATP-dependent NAD kinase
VTTVGIVANPASGKDIRRLVARASVFDNQEKQAIVRRVLAGIMSIPGARFQFAYLNDGHGLVRSAIEELGVCDATAFDGRFASARDTTLVAQWLHEQHADVVVTLGGDGTNRVFALGWADAPLVPISTGTNNVFPEMLEATVAGAAAGLIAHGAVALDEVAEQQKIVTVRIAGEDDDLALIDVVFLAERFVGARAILDPDQLRTAVLTRADPAAVGMTAIGGLLEPVDSRADHGLLLTFDGAPNLRAPLAPGYYREISVSRCSRLDPRVPVEVQGPGVLAFDGERERVLKPGQRATLSLERSGPRVVNVARTLHLAAARGVFQTDNGS